MRLSTWGTAVCLLCGVVPVPAQSFTLEASWHLRLRHEQVNDDAFVSSARADTVRLRAGLRFAFDAGWSAYIEGEGIAGAGNDYNSGANGRTQYPAIFDPDGAEFNQAWLGWQGKAFGAIAGRQRIALDNQRWVGDVGWRQNQQTFDAMTSEWKAGDALTIRYDWLASVQRVNGNKARDPFARERDLDTHLFNAGYKFATQQLTGYAYLNRDQDVAAASSATYGVRWTGDLVTDGNGWSWAAEGARQYDYGNNPQNFAHTYWLLEPAFSWRGMTVKAGWEHLAGNGQHALQTPLATLHAFNGWADKFVVTPTGGLEDRYLSVGGKFGQIRDGRFAWSVVYHDFRADKAVGGLDDYGREWDASLGFPLAPRLQVLLKLADYRSDGYARDTRKIWLQLEWSGPK